MTYKKITGIFLALFLGVSFIFSPYASAISEQQLKSGGKFFQNKGTRAAADYEEQGRLAPPVYEYGHGFHVGQGILKPIIQFSEQWENNIFLDENNRKSDWISRLDAGVDFEMPLNGGQHLLTAGYLGNFEWFNRFDEQDHDDHIGKFGLDLNYVPFTLQLDETFKQTVSRADTEFTDRVRRNENTAHGLLEVPFAAFFLETELYNFTVDYLEDTNDAFDHNDFNVFQRVGVDLSGRTQFLVEYGYKNLYYDQNHGRDGDGHQISLGLRGNATDRITYQVWGGWGSLVYEDDSRPDFNDFIFRAAAQYDITDKSNVVLSGARNPQESTFDDQSFYVRNRVRLTWRQQLMERFFMISDGILDYNEYSRASTRNGDSQTRRDYVWQAGIGFEYLMPNDLISFFGEYKYSARESNTFNLDYDAQTVNLGVKSTF